MPSFSSGSATKKAGKTIFRGIWTFLHIGGVRVLLHGNLNFGIVTSTTHSHNGGTNGAQAHGGANGGPTHGGADGARGNVGTEANPLADH
jgi:hypothetical protein